MGRLKSAYEIAMERAAKINGIQTKEEILLEKRERLKPLLAKFYREKIDAEELWRQLNNEEDMEVLVGAQVMLIDSIGLKITEEQLKKRKEGLLAIETLKKENNSSVLEQYLNQISAVKEQYEQERERIREMIEEAVQNAERQLKPVRTPDGRIAMRMEQSIDEDTQERLKNALSQLEVQSGQLLNQLLKELKDNL